MKTIWKNIVSTVQRMRKKSLGIYVISGQKI